ncbi:MAG: hypothetical protein AAF610_04025 [Pseudomonadota bacterium]
MFSEAVATAAVAAIGLYFLLGLMIALAFVWRGVARVDPAASEGTLGFRLVIFPGCVALWPWVVHRWRQGATPLSENNAHRAAARARQTAP